MREGDREVNERITAEDLALVKKIQKETGVLTVKDADTGFKGAKPYGMKYHVITNPYAVPPTEDVNVMHERTIIREFVGSSRWPEGIPIGGVTVWNRNTPMDIPWGDKDFKAVDFNMDICRSTEFAKLKAFALNRPWLTDAEKLAKEQENIRRRDGMRETQEDPVGAVARAIAAAMQQQQAPKAPAVASK